MIKRVKRWIRKEKAINAALILRDYCCSRTDGDSCNRCPLKYCCNELFNHSLVFIAEAIINELDK